MPSDVAVRTVEGADYRADSDIYAHSVTQAGRLGTIEPPNGGLATSVDLDGVVEPALARALVLAAEAQRWEIVEQLAGELKERRDRQLDEGPIPLQTHRIERCVASRTPGSTRT